MPDYELQLETEEEEEVPLSMGFGASAGNPDAPGRHKHSFHAFDGAAPYFKNHDARLGYLVLFCECGLTQETIVEDRR